MPTDAEKSIRILLVEDDGHISAIIRLGMQDLGILYHLDQAYSAEEALELWEQQPYDLVMTDYNLRGKNGLELIALVKQADSTTPTMLFTAYDTPKLRREAAAVGVTNFIAKPFFVDEFVNVTRSLLPTKVSEFGA
ncbi:MAG TPA: response regulator [Roseiflexaceae bacterium]|jgi:CheY-like chemotaxis protein|nr:response regulator [Roseiflexaceae bacterium]